MSRMLVDTNVLLDVLTDDAQWFDWSANALQEALDTAQVCINPLIYAEVSVGFTQIESLNEALPETDFIRLPLPWAAGFLAGKVFVDYRRSGGNKTAPLPDFYIGAHAAIEGMPLLTRDARVYRHYFPTLELITPER